jgi:hypothetical protein
MEAADQQRYASGLYAWLVEREELAATRWNHRATLAPDG